MALVVRSKHHRHGVIAILKSTETIEAADTGTRENPNGES